MPAPPPAGKSGPGEGAAPGRPRRREYAVLGVLLLVFLALRLGGVGVNPARFATNDEFHFAWAGQSLLETGRPMSWSYFPTATNTMATDVPWRPKPLTIVCPALDHPPLFSLLTGSAAKLLGSRRVAIRGLDPARPAWVYTTPLTGLRVMMVLLGALSLFLLFDVMRQVSGPAGAIAAGLLYACAMPIVVHQRLAVSENLGTVLLLACVWTAARHQNGRMTDRTAARVLALGTAAAVLCKVVFGVQALALFAWFCATGRRRLAHWSLAGAAAGFAVFLAYGWLENGSEFFQGLAIHSSRFEGFSTLFSLVAVPKIAHERETNLLIFCGWLALVARIGLGTRNPLIGAAPGYLLAFLFFPAASQIYGWHVLPFYPLLCAALGEVVQRTWTSSARGPAWLFLLLFLPVWAAALHDFAPSGVQAERWAYLVAVCGAASLPLVRPGVRTRILQGAVILLVGSVAADEALKVVRSDNHQREILARPRTTAAKSSPPQTTATQTAR